MLAVAQFANASSDNAWNARFEKANGTCIGQLRMVFPDVAYRYSVRAYRDGKWPSKGGEEIRAIRSKCRPYPNRQVPILNAKPTSPSQEEYPGVAIWTTLSSRPCSTKT